MAASHIEDTQGSVRPLELQLRTVQAQDKPGEGIRPSPGFRKYSSRLNL